MAAALCLISVLIYVLYFRDRSYSSGTEAFVDGHIETDDSGIAKAVKRLDDAEPADIVEDRAADETRVGIIFVGLTEEADTNEAIIRLIRDSGIRASFALSAAEAGENPDEVTDMLADGIEIISNGTSGESNVHLKSEREAVELMLKSRESLSRYTNTAVKLLYLSSTAMTSDILCDAAVSGYEAVISADAAHTLGDGSLETEPDAADFIRGLHGDSIVIFDLRGKPEDIRDEEFIVAEKPAIDKQPDLNDEKQEEDEKTPVITQAEWLINAIADEGSGISTEYVSCFERTEGFEALKGQLSDPEAKPSAVYSYCLTDKPQVGIGVKGLTENGSVSDTIAMLDRASLGATFFISADELEKNTAALNSLTSAGFGTGMYIPTAEIKELSRSEIFDRLYEERRLFVRDTLFSGLLLIDDECTGETLFDVQAAAGMLRLRIVQPEEPEKPEAGALYLIDVSDEQKLLQLSESAAAAGLKAVDMGTAVSESGTLKGMSPVRSAELRKNNGQELSEVQSMVYTTERTVGFAMYGMGRTAAVMDAADVLSRNNGRGTFFATLDELMNDQAAIQYIIDSGDDIGICYRAADDYPQVFDAVAGYIDTWNRYAEWRYGTDSDIVLMPYDTAADETLEAVHASGCRIVKPAFAAVRNEDRDITMDSVQEAVSAQEGLRLMRGSVVGFNMAFYSCDKTAERGNTVFGAVLESFIDKQVDSLAYHSYLTGQIEDESRFAIKTVGGVLSSPDKYEFCTDEQQAVAADKNVLSDMADDDERFEYIRDHYIGTSFVTSERKLPGFSAAEIKKLDKKGRFTDDKVLFLSFDDWGTEKSLNELLYVLDKYDVKATFFVTTQHVDSNPNLLRAIAEHGHQIASHTDGHLPLSDSAENSNRALSLTDEEAAELRSDIVESYNKLYKYTGDVVIDGRPALSKMFRPPTLAVSKAGISQVFDVGFSYSVSGDMSTDDYKAVSYEDMVNQLRNGITDDGDHISIHDGSIVVMHMLENAKYTAQALDTMIPVWQEQGYSFARLDAYLTDQ